MTMKRKYESPECEIEKFEQGAIFTVNPSEKDEGWGEGGNDF